ncbi:MAG: ComF family protein [Steroidobacteraceae bacterium]
MFKKARSLVNPLRQAWLTYGHFLTNTVAPPVCLLCGGTGQDGRNLDPPGAWGLDLCPHCEAACPAAAPEHLAAPRGIDRLRALFLYEPPVDELIQRLKFHHQLVSARVLGMLMAQAWHGTDLPQALVPVPLHAQRLRERGFNQAAEIGRHLAPRLKLPLLSGLLERQRNTAAQSGLAAAERARNIAGAFRLKPGAVPPAHVALLDDVLTTGATAAAAASALRQAGCGRVELWVCARTPPPGPRSGRRSEHADGFC